MTLKRVGRGDRSEGSEEFNLSISHWIPCEKSDGTVVELSTYEALAQAHLLKGLAIAAPTEQAAVYRHLLAVLHRVCCGPRSMRDWSEIAQAGRFDSNRVGDYLGAVRDRLDLFHPRHPFAQTRGLVEQFSMDPIDQLGVERSSWGTARALFQHRGAAYAASMSPAEATRALLQHHAFATGGLVKKPNEPTSATAAPFVRGAVVVLRGPTLFHTLVSNLLVYDPAESKPVAADESDAPSWEQEPLPRQLRVKSEPKRAPKGWLDMLTWLSRRIELVCNGDAVVGFVRAVGKGMADPAPRDPMVAYRRDDKRGFVALGLSPERAFWRNANALFEAAGAEGASYEPPQAIAHLSRREAKTVLAAVTRYSVESFGIAAEKSRVDLARREQVVAPLQRFGDADAREAVKAVLLFANEAVSALRKALWSYARYTLSPAEREPDGKDISNFVRSTGAVQAAWSDLGTAFETFLRALEAEDLDPPCRAFEDQARDVVERRFREAAAGAEATGRALKARAIAERSLYRAMSKLPRTELLDETPDTPPQEAEA